MFAPADRVEVTTDYFRIRGTVKKLTPAGYVCVKLDDGVDSMWTPGLASVVLRLCDPGDDSRPRHSWCSENFNACSVCGVRMDEQTLDMACAGPS